MGVKKIKKESFDLVIIGAGSVGSATFRDACRRGFKACLIDKNFVGRQTNDASLGIFHRGGLNYVASDVNFVRMCANDCEAMHKIAGHMFKTQRFIIPVFKNSTLPLWAWDGILEAYDNFAYSGSGEIQKHQKLSGEDIYSEEPLLKGALSGIRGGVLFEEFRVDPVALSLAMVEEGKKIGGKLFERSEIFGFVKNHDEKRIKKIYVRNSGTGEETVIEAKCFINSTGPWASSVVECFGLSGFETSMTKGTSIILNTRLSSNALVLFKEGLKYYAVMPWGNEQTLVGPTNYPISDEVAKNPDELKPEEFEIDELLGVVSYFFNTGVEKKDIVEIKCGIRPQLKHDDGKNVVYRFMITNHGGFNFLTIFGGKLTNQLRMAKEVLDRASCEVFFKDEKSGVQVALRQKWRKTLLYRLGSDEQRDVSELSDEFTRGFYLKEYAVGQDYKAGNSPMAQKLKLAAIVAVFMLKRFTFNLVNSARGLKSRVLKRRSR